VFPLLSRQGLLSRQVLDFAADLGVSQGSRPVSARVEFFGVEQSLFIELLGRHFGVS